MHFRTLWKIGLAADFKDVTLGLTVTTPSLDIGGKGTTGMNSTLAGLDTDGDGAPDDYLAADYRDGLDSYFQTPFSIAAGMTFKIQKIRIYWSTEWFAAVKPYTVVDAGEFPAQSTGEMLSTDVTHELAPVLNFGMGLEWFYSSRFKGYGSFTTDYSAKKTGTTTNLSLTDWDIYHIVTGGELKLSKILDHRRPRLFVRQPGDGRPPGPPAAGRAGGAVGPVRGAEVPLRHLQDDRRLRVLRRDLGA